MILRSVKKYNNMLFKSLKNIIYLPIEGIKFNYPD